MVTAASSGFGQATATLLAGHSFGLYASSKFALEGMIDRPQDELRPFHITVSLVDPTFFRTKFVAQPPATTLAEYEPARQSMLRLVREGVAQGPDPGQVARRTAPGPAFTRRDHGHP